MTAICTGGGPSEARPGFGISVSMSVAGVAALLNNIPTRYAVVLAGLIGGVNYELSEFCSHDPPAVPDITAGDVESLLSFQRDPFAAAAAGQKFQQLVGAFAWYQFCKCTSGPTPAAPAAPPTPVGLPTIDPISIVPPLATPCGLPVDANVPANDASFGPRHPHGHVPPLDDINPANIGTLADITLSILPDGATHTGVTWTLNWFDTLHDNTFAPAEPIHVSAVQGSVHLFRNVPIGAEDLDLSFVPDNSASTDRVVTTVRWYCNGAVPGRPVLTPCQPDPTTQAMLQQIMDLVKLIQRQKVPFAYVPGARHNGVSGSGQFAVHGLIGVSVILTTVPPYLGNIAGDPPEIFDAGFVTVGSADGWHRSIRLDHNPTLILPIEGSETLIGYTLEPNVVVDILELVREP